MLKRTGLLIQSVFYVLAGLNHFIQPEFYYPLIPDYLPWHQAINVVAGLAEILLGTGLLFAKTRKLSADLIILMLVLFIPSHIYFIQIGGCLSDGLCAPLWVGWLRLILIHPLLIIWAYRYRNYPNQIINE